MPEKELHWRVRAAPVNEKNNKGSVQLREPNPKQLAIYHKYISTLAGVLVVLLHRKLYPNSFDVSHTLTF